MHEKMDAKSDYWNKRPLENDGKCTKTDRRRTCPSTSAYFRSLFRVAIIYAALDAAITFQLHEELWARIPLDLERAVEEMSQAFVEELRDNGHRATSAKPTPGIQRVRTCSNQGKTRCSL